MSPGCYSGTMNQQRKTMTLMFLFGVLLAGGVPDFAAAESAEAQGVRTALFAAG